MKKGGDNDDDDDGDYENANSIMSEDYYFFRFYNTLSDERRENYSF
jgi:hypothetical protein